MINFLRKLRRKEMKGSKSAFAAGRYFKYAVGEIFLVVIGILIALSINNWNTKRQQQIELKGYLEKIASNMEQDITLAEEYAIKRDSSNQLCSQAVKSLLGEEPNLGLVMRAASSVIMEFYFVADKSGFEALKTSGYIGKLKDARLDSLLSKYYFTLEKLEREEISYNTFIESMEASWLKETSLLPIMSALDIQNGGINDPEAFIKTLENNRDIILARPIEAVIVRGSSETLPQAYYRELIQIGSAFIEEVKQLN